MKRPFDFKDDVKDRARFRQFGLCAQCGDSMNDLEEHAHHVVPNQSGQAGNPDHAWLMREENCVVLCDGCHYVVHDSGRNRYGAVAPPEYFAHSHGLHHVAHLIWVADLNQKMNALWGPKLTERRRS